MKNYSILGEVQEELERALEKHGPVKSPHEGLAILEEEVDEFRRLVYEDGQYGRMIDELIQVAAVATRIIKDVLLKNARIRPILCTERPEKDVSAELDAARAAGFVPPTRRQMYWALLALSQIFEADENESVVATEVPF